MRHRQPADVPGHKVVGQIVGAFGLRGEVKIEPLTNIESRFKKGKKLYLEGFGEVQIEAVRTQKGRYIAKLSGLTSVEEAEAQQWRHVYVSEDDEPDLEEGEYLVDDLIGLKVKTIEGRELGEVDDVLQYPAHDILVVGPILIPAIPEFVELVDFDEEVITVRLIEGMEDG